MTGSATQRQRVLFMGTPALAVPTLAALAESHRVVGVVTQPDRPAGRGRRTVASPVKEWAVEHQVRVLQPRRLTDAGVVQKLAEFDADVCVVVAFGQLLPPEVLELPRLGCVNLHASLLPRHRGASPIQAAILAGDAETGVTTMLMDEGLDTGPVLLRSTISITPADTAGTLGARLATAGAELTVDTIGQLAVGRLEPVPQDDSAATMTRLIRKSDGEVDWERSAEAIERQIRAMQPWPVAHTHLGGDPLRIWQATPARESLAAAPGTVVQAEGELTVACGTGALVLEEIQRAGGRRLSAAEFLRGHPVAPGTRLGADRHG